MATETKRKRPASAGQVTSTRRRSSIRGLATPKFSKASWWTSFEPRLVWGNQEPIVPIKSAALKAVPSQRIEQLALPKKDQSLPLKFIPQYLYGCGRPSTIWTIADVSLQTIPTQRIQDLALPKKIHPKYIQHRPQFEFSCGRPSTIWESQPQSWPERPRTAMLAKPKKTHPLYKPCKEVPTVVSRGALSCSTSQHTEYLAKPKVRFSGAFRDAQWSVSAQALQASPSEKILELSKAKKLAEGYKPSRGPQWKVGKGALNAVTSTRMEELSKPIMRETMDHVQFDPDVFNVSETAKKAKASKRIEELAQPIQRGN